MSERLQTFGRGLRRAQAAAYVGVSQRLFDELVAHDQLPRPRLIGGGRVKIWNKADLDDWLDSAPVDGEDPASDWDEVLG